MKAPSLLALFAAGVLAACGETAPATKRLLHDPPIDLPYLHNVFIPSYDAGSRAKLIHSVEHLEGCLAEIQAFMKEVEQGRIKVTQNFKTGNWQSFVKKPDNLIMASYVDRLGPIRDFRKDQNKSPASMLFHIRFHTTGYIERVEMPLESFVFDDLGRLRRWYGENEPYQIGLTNRWSQPLADVLSCPDFMRDLPMFVTHALASGASALSR